ncbi:phosphocholine cytidylyltransferase family protein, partial [Burkholderia thailandensis]|nr:phosphocholine cytidylyltransferase family protein [Burkholderia thailandensis]
MRAIILAAALGLPLQLPPEAQFPKCLLRFADTALLERSLRGHDASGAHAPVLAPAEHTEKTEAQPTAV